MADPLTPPAQGSAEKPGARSFSSRSEKRSVAKSPVSLQVGFYNIEWTESQLSGHDHETHRKQLGRDCAQAFEFHDLGMLCLCGVGTNKLDENLDAHLGNSAGFLAKYGGQNVNTWLEQVIQECCRSFIDLQAYVLGPYAIVLDSRCRSQNADDWHGVRSWASSMRMASKVGQIASQPRHPWGQRY